MSDFIDLWIVDASDTGKELGSFADEQEARQFQIEQSKAGVPVQLYHKHHKLIMEPVCWLPGQK